MRNHTVHRALLICLLPLLFAFQTGMAAPLRSGGAGDPAGPARETFYSQDPDYDMVYNKSSGFDAEIADDIPADLAPAVVGSVVFWVGEWYGAWQDPLGLQVSFYSAACPPALEPAQSCFIPWDEWSAELVHVGLARVYRAEASLPAPLSIEPGMSLGVTVVIDWGSAEPFAGVCATPYYVSFGDCTAYLDGQNWGYTRWTPIDEFTNIPQDLAYGLRSVATAIPENAAEARLRLRAHPNPFNPRCTLRFDLPASGSVSLKIFSVSGREIATLLDGHREAGPLSVDWLGRDAAERPAAAGVYLARLSCAAGVAHCKLVLLD